MAGDAFGLASLYDPSIATDEAALQRQMALAQALRQASMEAQGRTQMAGNVAIRNSPLEGVAKVVQALRANQLDSQNDVSRQGLSTKTMAAMAALLRGNEPGASPGATADASTVPPTNVPQGGMSAPGGMGLPQLLRGSVINQLGGPAMAGAYAKNFEPLDIDRQLQSAGITNPALAQEYKQGRLAKENYVPPANIRPGGYTQDIQGRVQQFPHVPDGFQAVPDGKGGFQIVPVQGGPQAIASSEEAKGLGRAGAQTQEVWDPAANNGNGGKVLRTTRQVIDASQSQVPRQVQNGRDVDRMGILQAERATLVKSGQPTTDIDKEIALTRRQLGQTAGPMAATPPLGVEKGAEAAAGASQGAIDKSWEPLKAQNREAANTKSYLQNIVQAAERGAIVGPGADRRELIQGVLQLAGIKEDVNTNAIDQTTLLDKYHNQIVTRLGQGGLGTDAARSMLDSAYPGKGMNVGAIREAAANLNGAQDMTQAKTRFLQEPALKRDSSTYQQREILFDQAADPRIWQWKAIQNPDAKKAFARSLIQQDPTLPQRIKALEEAGAL